MKCNRCYRETPNKPIKIKIPYNCTSGGRIWGMPSAVILCTRCLDEIASEVERIDKNPYGAYPSMIEWVEKQLNRAENENPNSNVISDLRRTICYTIHSGNFFCTKTHKYNRAIHGDIRVIHVDATEEWAEDGYPGGDITHYKCPHYGETWSSEVAQ